MTAPAYALLPCAASVLGFCGSEMGGGGSDDVAIGLIEGPMAGPIVDVSVLRKY